MLLALYPLTADLPRFVPAEIGARVTASVRISTPAASPITFLTASITELIRVALSCAISLADPPSLDTPRRMRAESGRTRTEPSPSIAIRPVLANPKDSMRGVGMLSNSRRRASGSVSPDWASAGLAHPKLRQIRTRWESLSIVRSV